MAKESKMKRVEKHLYKAQYQTSDGNWSTRYYGLFRDWKKNSRCFPLGDNLQGARDKLGVLDQRNHAEFDFDEEREKRAKAAVPVMTLEKWVPQFLNLIRANKSAGRDAQHCVHLTGLLGKEPLEAIGGNTILEYKNKRLAECIVRYGKPVKGKLVKISTVNREIRCLIHALRKAEDAKLIDKAPSAKLDSEAHLIRDRVLSEDEYENLLDTSPRWLQRIFVGAMETCLSQGDLLRLTWADVYERLIKVPGGRQKTGIKQRVGISPALRQVLDELRTEQLRIANMEGRVFTSEGRPVKVTALRAAFDKAVATAEITDFHFHDFRHCAKTAWSADGLHADTSDVGSGHAIPGMRGRYTNLSDAQIIKNFEEMFAHQVANFLKPFKNGNDTAASVVSK